jgi:hypothetical protein
MAYDSQLSAFDGDATQRPDDTLLADPDQNVVKRATESAGLPPLVPPPLPMPTATENPVGAPAPGATGDSAAPAVNGASTAAPTTDGTPAAGQHWSQGEFGMTPMLDDPWGGATPVSGGAGTQEAANWKNGGDLVNGLGDYNAMQTSSDPNAKRLINQQYLNTGHSQEQLDFEQHRDTSQPLVPGSPQWEEYKRLFPESQTGGAYGGGQYLGAPKFDSAGKMLPFTAPSTAAPTSQPQRSATSATPPGAPPALPSTPWSPLGRSEGYTPGQVDRPLGTASLGPTTTGTANPMGSPVVQGNATSGGITAAPAKPAQVSTGNTGTPQLPSATSLAPTTTPSGTPPFTSKDVAIGSTVLPNASSRLGGLQSMVDQATGKLAAVDRTKLAEDMFGQFSEATDPAYAAALRRATQVGAGAGRVGSGMLRTTYGDLASQRAQQLDLAKRGFMSSALEGSIQDQFNKQRALSGLEGQLFGQEQSQRGELRGERGYQGGLEEQSYERALQQYLTEQQQQRDRFQRAMQLTAMGEAGNPSQSYLQASGQYQPLDLYKLAQSMNSAGGATQSTTQAPIPQYPALPPKPVPDNTYPAGSLPA